MKEQRKARAPKFWEALLVFALIIAVIIYTLNFKVGMQTPMILGCMIACLLYTSHDGYGEPGTDSAHP